MMSASGTVLKISTVPEVAQDAMPKDVDPKDGTLDLRLLAMVAILAAGLLGSLPPLYLKVFKDEASPATRVLRAFAGGIILALALVHVMPDGIKDMESLSDYPLGGLTVLMGVVFMVLLEQVSQLLMEGTATAHAHAHAHSHVRANAHAQTPQITHMPVGGGLEALDTDALHAPLLHSSIGGQEHGHGHGAGECGGRKHGNVLVSSDSSGTCFAAKPLLPTRPSHEPPQTAEVDAEAGEAEADGGDRRVSDGGGQPRHIPVFPRCRKCHPLPPSALIASKGDTLANTASEDLVLMVEDHHHSCLRTNNTMNWVLSATPPAQPAPTLKEQIAACMFEFGCLAHSFLIGLALGATVEGRSQVIALLIALCFHQCLEGLGLGSVVVRAQFPRHKAFGMVLAYSVTTPIGVAVGIFVARTFNPESAAAISVQGALNCISAGMLLYISLVQLIAEDFSREDSSEPTSNAIKLAAYFALAAGASCMCLLALWT